MHKTKNENLLRKQLDEKLRAQFDATLRASKKKGKTDIQESIRAARKPVRPLIPPKETELARWITHKLTFRPYNKALERIILVCEEKSDLLNDLGGKTSSVREGLSALAGWSTFWIRQPEDWKPNSHNVYRQFASLARHLFAKYRIPSFMDDAWLNLSCTSYNSSGAEQEWYIHIGNGGNIRKADKLPFPLTKMMAHHFLEAPDGTSIRSALIWGLCRSMGASERITRTLLACRQISTLANLVRPQFTLAQNNIMEKNKTDGYFDFWQSVIRFFIEHDAMLDLSQVGPMIDYIENQKYTRIGGNDPAQPGFSMHRRDINALLNLTQVWHRQLARAKDSKNLQWESSGIPGFDKMEGPEGNQRRFMIEELLSSNDLKVEGAKMHHCVYSYARNCFEKRFAIFSLKGDYGQGLERRTTIEVNLATRQITQARTKFNAPATALDRRIISAWATKANLGFSRYAMERAV